MKVLFNTDVIIDALTNRSAISEIAQELCLYSSADEIKGFLISKQLTDLFYILRKYCSDISQRKKTIRILSESFTILPFLGSDIKPALDHNITDFEDAIIEEVAKVNCIDYIVTSNVKDFVKSRVNVILPEELLKLIKLSKGDF